MPRFEEGDEVEFKNDGVGRPRGTFVVVGYHEESGVYALERGEHRLAAFDVNLVLRPAQYCVIVLDPQALRSFAQSDQLKDAATAVINMVVGPFPNEMAATEAADKMSKTLGGQWHYLVDQLRPVPQDEVIPQPLNPQEAA